MAAAAVVDGDDDGYCQSATICVIYRIRRSQHAERVSSESRMLGVIDWYHWNRLQNIIPGR